ncbi:hypothetical protein DERP_009998 [Dermatophagoides pteronyssinus]|uniref:Uncharacterized protein n=1 Tax=Dermatophagoides pteronyssinus TaxID=6956 RepID=A0ABQ8J250_DERPT|nr:hypothetical protein DERP_009998 [Dermatophagoides pteronyssinus]
MDNNDNEYGIKDDDNDDDNQITNLTFDQAMFQTMLDQVDVPDVHLLYLISIINIIITISVTPQKLNLTRASRPRLIFECVPFTPPPPPPLVMRIFVGSNERNAKFD